MEKKWPEFAADYLYKTSDLVLVGASGSSFFIYLALNSYKVPHIGYWFLSILTSTILAYIGWVIVYKKKILKSLSPTKMINVYWWLLLPGWIHWAILSLYFYPRLPGDPSLFVSIILCGVASSSIPLYLTSQRLLITALIGALVPFFIGCCLSGQKFSYLLSLSVILYLGILLRSAKTQYSSAFNEYSYYEENKKLLQELQIKSNELIDKAKSNILIDMASGMAHEINNPLTTIMLQVDLLDLQLNNKNPSMNKMNSISSSLKKNANRILDITKHLSYFFENSTNKQINSIDLEYILNELKNEYQDILRKENIELIASTSYPNTKLICNQHEIIQALKHLINNSIEACIQSQEPRWISILVEEENEHVRISISDSGAGISTEIQEKIMNPFFTTKEIGKGLGLGLSISNSVIRQHKGYIQLDANNKNTTFNIYLPRVKDKNAKE